MMKTETKKTLTDIPEHAPCIYGADVKDVCPVLIRLSEKAFKDYANPVVKQQLSGFPMEEIATNIQRMVQLTQGSYDRLIPFCHACPFPEIYSQQCYF